MSRAFWIFFLPPLTRSPFFRLVFRYSLFAIAIVVVISRISAVTEGKRNSIFFLLHAVSANKLNLCCRKQFYLQSLFRTRGMPNHNRHKKKLATSFSIWSHVCVCVSEKLTENTLRCHNKIYGGNVKVAVGRKRAMPNGFASAWWHHTTQKAKTMQKSLSISFPTPKDMILCHFPHVIHVTMTIAS